MNPGLDAIRISDVQASQGGDFSPDGDWVAYQTAETGMEQVFMERFPPSGRRIQVSLTGGGQPRWSRNGKELFYATQDGRLMAVAIDGGAEPAVSSPEELFRVPEGIHSFDVTSDGQRFLVIERLEDEAAAPLTVILNWKEKLAQK